MSRLSIEWRSDPVVVSSPAMIKVGANGLSSGTMKTLIDGSDEAARRDSFEKIMRESASLMFGDDLCREPEGIIDGKTGSDDDVKGKDQCLNIDSNSKYTSSVHNHSLTKNVAIRHENQIEVPIKDSSDFLSSAYDYLVEIERRFPSNMNIPQLKDLSRHNNASMDEFLPQVR